VIRTQSSVPLRIAGPEDFDFLARVYASTRTEELAPVPWSSEQKAAFLRSQAEAQDKYYRENYTTAEFLVILDGDVPVGRLYVDRWPDEIRLMDIALLPEHRGKGLGTRLLRDLQDEARASGLALRIHVERMNPALGLYRRLGFKPVEDRGVYHLMEWRVPQEGPR
jgi:ribosomal protein S18 acetylase RimI-like enzyme